MDKNENKQCNCSPDCDCGCQEGKPCTCDHKNEKCDCGCHDGKECHCHDHDCDDDCDCGCHDGKECHCHDHDCDDDCDCGCHDGKECHCHDHEHDCDDDHCECHGFADSEEFKKYEKAFLQLEDALIKVDKELTQTKKLAEHNEKLAESYKKDLERFKERTKEQALEVELNAVSNIADKLLPIVDNFEQALKVTADKNVLKGFEMIYSMLKNAISSLGIEEINAENQPFDPNLHNAVSKVPTNNKKLANTVASVYQKGYKFAGKDGKVIRHSVVEIYLQD